MPTTIRKALISSFGDVSKISVVDSTISDPPANHVQVKVIYSGFAGSDINMRLGVYPLQKKAPLTPGYSLIGTVHANGVGSTKFRQGDLVACLSIYDAEAELANLPEKFLIKVPAGLDLRQATPLILDWNTAYGMVTRAARVSRGQKVFVHGMSGAVGYATMMLCKLQGAEVYGTASPKKHALIRNVGATPFTYANKDWLSSMKQLGGVHAVFDPLGFESWDESFSILRPDGGVLVGYGGNGPTLNGQAPKSAMSVVLPTLKLLARNLIFWSHKRTNFYYIARDQPTFEPSLNALFDLLKQGTITVPIKSIFALEDIQDAHRNWTNSSGVGSVLIKVGDVPW